MSYSEFQRDLRKIYISEVMGEALFSTAAKLSWNQAHKNTWTHLSVLETQTKNKYLAFTGGGDNFPTMAKLFGHLFGLVFVIVPWVTAMKLLRNGTDSFLQTFQRLLDHASEQDKAFYSYVVAHEAAIAAFARAEIAADKNSLAHITALLENADT